jgi:hypothetical protein
MRRQEALMQKVRASCYSLQLIPLMLRRGRMSSWWRRLLRRFGFTSS